MADEFGYPTRRTITTTSEPVTGEPVVYTETSFDTTYSDDSPGYDPEPSTADVAKEQATQVGQGAAEAGQHVAGVAKDQASGVAAEAADQARNLYEQTRQELAGQAASQQQRLAEGVRSLGSQLESMADRADAGTASDLVREASGRARDVAGWLDQRNPGALLQEVTDFARRRPGAFLAIAAGAGLIAGRLTRGAISQSSSSSSTGGAPVAGSTGTPVAGYSAPTPEPAYERYETVGVETTYEETVPGTSYPVGREGVR